MPNRAAMELAGRLHEYFFHREVAPQLGLATVGEIRAKARERLTPFASKVLMKVSGNTLSPTGAVLAGGLIPTVSEKQSFERMIGRRVEESAAYARWLKLQESGRLEERHSAEERAYAEFRNDQLRFRAEMRGLMREYRDCYEAEGGVETAWTVASNAVIHDEREKIGRLLSQECREVARREGGNLRFAIKYVPGQTEMPAANTAGMHRVPSQAYWKVTFHPPVQPRGKRAEGSGR